MESSFTAPSPLELILNCYIAHHGQSIFYLYLALGNIALVFAAQVSRDSEIAGISRGIAIGISYRGHCSLP